MTTQRLDAGRNQGSAPKQEGRTRTVHWWVRRGFLLWACVSTLWLANSVRTQGVGDKWMRSDENLTVNDGAQVLEFLPASSSTGTGLIFMCGAGVDAQAYAPLLRPIAEAGFPVFVVRLPYRFAPLESHKEEALARVHRVIASHGEVARWALSGHSLGAALAARFAHSDQRGIAALVLVGTTHPRDQDLTRLELPVTKVYATNDGVATVDGVMSNRALLPPQTKWVEIEGGNHSQFGHYGHQLFDGTATITREAQQGMTRSALLGALASAAKAITAAEANSRSESVPR